MNAPVLWILIPLGFSILLLFLRNSPRLSQWLAFTLSFLLTIAAIVFPIGSALKVGPLVIDISTTFEVLGRRFVLNGTDSLLLALIYALGSFWFLGASVANAPRLLYSFGMAIIAILVASAAVEPFLYAALLVEMAVLISIPMLVEAQHRVGDGVVRYLIFQTLAMPFILLAGWVLGSVEVSPSRELLLQQASVFLGLGFSFWLAVFPFYSWIPLLVDETHPYLAGFLLSLLPTVMLFLGLDFVNGFTWLRSSEILYQVLQLVGLMMVVTAGVWAAFQQDMTRLFGYGVIFSTGFALLALSTHQAIGMEVFATSFLPRLLILAVWALALTILRNHGISLRLPEMRGVIRRYPFASAALVLSCFSFGGMPLMANFTSWQGLLSLLSQKNLILTLWAMAGGVGFLFSGFRLLFILVWGERLSVSSEETRWQKFFLACGMLTLIYIGLFPREILASLLPLLQAFPNLYP